jgi:hypothetical protein
MHRPQEDVARRTWLAPAILALGIGLRLEGLDTHSLWYDEGATVFVATAPSIAEALQLDRHPPLSFFAFRAWIALFGQSDSALRLLPALLSCVSLVLFVDLARRLLPRAWVVPALLYAVSPFHVWHGQEVRMYAFAELGALLALTGLAGLPTGTSRAAPLLVFLGTAAAIGSHYLGALVVPAALCVIAAARRVLGTPRARCLATAAATLLGAIVWLPWCIELLPRQAATGWGHAIEPSLRKVIELPVHHVMIETSSVLSGMSVGLGYLLGAILLAGFVVCCYRTIRWRSFADLFCALCFFVPALALLASALLLPCSFVAKYLVVASPAAILMIGSGLSFRRSAATAVLSAAAVAGCLSITVLHKRANLREDYRSACAELIDAWRPGETVACVTGTYEGFSEATVRHYLREHPDMLARTIDGARLLQGDAVVPEIVHVIYRDAIYAWSTMEALREKLGCVSAGPPRFRIQHLRFQNPASK